MKLVVPHNWDSNLVARLDTRLVEGFYGKLDKDVIGGGRSSNICSPVSRRVIKREVQKLHGLGLEFNYLLNGDCLDNRELSHPMIAKLSALLEWLVDISVDSVSVSLPYLAKFISKNYSALRIHVSTMAQVDTPDKAKFWEDLGVDKITLYEVDVNRSFERIKSIRESVACKIQLIANNLCLRNCPFTVYHGVACSHASQVRHVSRNFFIDFYRLFCMHMRLNNPVDFIRADWIRPEDLSHYELLGVDSIKLVNRGMNTTDLARIVKAYTDRQYKGNLLDLLPSTSKNINFSKNNYWGLFKYFFHPQFVNIFKLPNIKKSFLETGIYIDNNKLDGFLESLQKQNCDGKLCRNCTFCDAIAVKAMKWDSVQVAKLKKEMEWLLNQFISGELFYYFSKS